jgi:glycosyltransferase involved in cell wall biosynthesis
MTPRWVRGKPIITLIHQLAREIWFYETPFPLSTVGRYLLEPIWLRAYRDIPALTVSQSSAESLARYHGWRDVTIVPEGSTPHPMPEVAKEQNPTIVFLGRLVAMKRPQDALAAFRLLTHNLPSAKMWVIGDGPLRTRLEQQAPPGVTFLGRISREELIERLARAHVLVATSVREGWGLNVSDAAACGTPSIAYSVPGLLDSTQASGGAVVDPNPKALSQALFDFCSGSLKLHPKISTLPWPDVAEVIEDHLKRVRHRYARVSTRTSPAGPARP